MLGIFEEAHKLHNLDLGLVASRDVVKRHRDAGLLGDARVDLTESKQALCISPVQNQCKNARHYRAARQAADTAPQEVDENGHDDKGGHEGQHLAPAP